MPKTRNQLSSFVNAMREERVNILPVQRSVSFWLESLPTPKSLKPSASVEKIREYTTWCMSHRDTSGQHSWLSLYGPSGSMPVAWCGRGMRRQSFHLLHLRVLHKPSDTNGRTQIQHQRLAFR